MTHKTFPFLYCLCALAGGCGDVVQSREDGLCFTLVVKGKTTYQVLKGQWWGKDSKHMAVKQTSHVGTS